ncbi:MAG: hypothetical protein GY927_21070 [bacterium]|nr:hypothetical protein [bacterium]
MGAYLHAQELDEKTKQELKQKEKRRQEAADALKTLTNWLETRKEQEKMVKGLKAELQAAKEDATKKEVEEKIKDANSKLEKTEKQIVALSTGVSSDDAKDDGEQKFDLQAELVSLVQPFIKMMKDATADARKIDELKITLASAKEKVEIAERAMDRLSLLSEIEKADKPKGKTATRVHLKKITKEWQKHKREALDLKEATDQRLTLLHNQHAKSSDGIGGFATDFIRTRGINLLLAITAFGGVLLIANLIAKLSGWIQKKRNLPRTFLTRLITLLFRVFSFFVAFIAMLVVFNSLTDWVLLGVASLFALGIAWLGLKMLPEIVEQVVLLLNLGAVQEGERVTLAGVPWLVERLDFHTDLVNPSLEGGAFTLPVRELVGLHSRPSGNNEPWFPTNKGNWVQFEGDRIGQVISQTPALVQIEELGGSLVTYETAGFLGLAPKNLSTGFRIKIEFGLDYKHQKIATSEIPNKLRDHVHAGLVKLLSTDGIKKLDVDLYKAGDSALIYEVEAELPGHVASFFEDIERDIMSLLVEAVNIHGWTIPFPQMVVRHQRVSS